MRNLFFTNLLIFMLAGLTPAHAQLLTFSVENTTVNCEDGFVEVDVTVDNFNSIKGFQFGLTWNPAVLQFDNISNNLPPIPIYVTTDAVNGNIKASWGDFNPPLDGETFSAGAVIFTLRFNVIGSGGSSTPISIVSFPGFDMEFVGPMGNIIPLNQVIRNNGAVSIFDSEAPIFQTCPANLTVAVLPGTPSTQVSWTPPTVTDNCNVASLTSVPLANHSFPVGTTNVTYTATDDAGNTSTCSFTVTIVEDPTANLLKFKALSSNILCNTAMIDVDVKVFNFDSVNSFQYGIGWDTAVLKYDSHQSFLPPTGNLNNMNAANGELGIAWADLINPFGTTLPDDSTIVRIRFMVNGAGGDSSAIKFQPFNSILEIAKKGVVLTPLQYVLENGKVKIIDNQAPAIAGCPGDITVQVPIGVTQATASWTPPTASDNCNIASFSSNRMPNSTFNLGTTAVVYTATDDAGNTTTCNFNVTVMQDPNAGKVTLKAVTTNTTCGASNVIVDIKVENFDSIISLNFGVMWDTAVLTFASYQDFMPPIAFYNTSMTAGGKIGLTWASLSTFLSLPNDSTILRLHFTVSGNGSSAIQFVDFPSAIEIGVAGNIVLTPSEYILQNGMVNVSDTEDPVFQNCPTDILLDTDAGICTATASWAIPTVTDDCDNSVTVTQIAGPVPGSNLSIDSFEVAYVAMDDSGNTDTCTFTVIVRDLQPPVFSGCPAMPIEVFNQTDSCSAIVNWPNITATDNCSGAVTITRNFSPGSRFPADTTEVVYIATDSFGNSDTCSFLVVVFDIQPPSMTCPSNVRVFATMPDSSAIVNGIAPMVLDNCAIDTVFYSFSGASAGSGGNDASGSTFAFGMTNVLYFASDVAGNSFSCGFNVEVVLPAVTISCPDSLTVENDASRCDAAVDSISLNILTGAGAVDSIGFILSGATTGTGSPDASGTVFNLGVTTVEYKLYDLSGDSLTCSFTVTVEDTEAPVFTDCPPNDTVNCVGAIIWTSPVVSDNCGLVSYDSTHVSGSNFPFGATTVTYTARDSAGNISTCSFIIFVQDTIAPVFSNCPTNDTLDCAGVVTWTSPIVSDNCGIVFYDSTHVSGSNFPFGATTVTYTARDSAGNISTCSFTVFVQDTIAPVFSNCPTNDTLDCAGVVTWTSPIVSDNCGLVSYDSTHVSGSNFPFGTTTVIYTARDSAGNVSTCSFTIFVQDAEAPVFSSCPSNIQVNCEGPVTWMEPVATDNCPTGLVVTSTHNSGDTFSVGVTTVTYTARDSAGNTTICSFTVTVQDTVAPVFDNCPQDINIPGNCTATVGWPLITATDNCSVDQFFSTHNPGNIFPLGTTTVTYTAIDVAGNIATCSFDVTVRDTTLPVIDDCPVDFTVQADPITCDALVTWTPPTATDACSAVTLRSNFDPDTILTSGAYQIVYIAEDAEGNADTCSFTVTVSGVQPPVFGGCPADILVDTLTVGCSAIVTWTPPTVLGICSSATVTASHAPGDTFPVGRTIVTYIAIENGGSGRDTCSFEITVMDGVVPVMINCPSDTTVAADPGTCKATATWIPPTATDNCGVIDFTESHAPGSEFNAPTTTVFYMATDDAGNTAVCQFDVNIQDMEPPTILCAPEADIFVDGTVRSDPSGIITFTESVNCNSVRVFFMPPITSDSCSTVMLRRLDNTGLFSGDIFPIGTTELIYQAVDASGNVAECSQLITISRLGNIIVSANPGTICEGGDVELSVVTQVPGATFTWFGPGGFASSAQDTILENVTPSQSGNYSVFATSPGGCIQSGNVDVTIFERPELSVSFNAALCPDGNSDLLLFAEDTANTTIISWEWDGPLSFQSFNQNPVRSNFEAGMAGVYTVVARNSDGCTAAGSVTVNAGSNPGSVTLVPIGNDYKLCVNETATLLGTQFNPAGTVYNWTVTPATGVIWTPTNNNSLAMTFIEAGDFEVCYWVTIGGCSSDTACVVLTVDARPQLSLSTNAPLFCTDGTQSLTLTENNSQADTYLWTGPAFNSNNQNVTITNVNSANAGLYTLTAVKGDGCQTQASINVEITDGPSPRTPVLQPQDPSICLGEQLQLTGQTYTNIVGVVYKWTATPAFGSGLPTISNNNTITVTPTIPGVYTFNYHVVVAGCTTDTVQTIVTVNNLPTINLDYNDPLDCVDENTDLLLTANTPTGVEWTWAGPDNFSSNAQNPVISPVKNANAGVYTLTVEDANNCTNTATINVTVTEGLAKLTITADQVRYCEDEDPIILSTTSIPGAVYIWTGPVQINTVNDTLFIPVADASYEGDYTVIATAQNGCKSPISDPVTVEIIEAPEAVLDNVSVIFETPITISVLLNDTLDPNQSFDITVVSDPQKGTLENLKDGRFVYRPNAGALDEDFFTYEICYDSCRMLCTRAVVNIVIDYDPNECVIPTVITPNGDGDNEEFIISCIRAGTAPDSEITIFNEWGGRVFHAAPYQNDWDGTYKGEPLPDGTYYYIFIRSPNAKPDKGFVTIFR